MRVILTPLLKKDLLRFICRSEIGRTVSRKDNKRILLLVHKDLVPPQELPKKIDRYKTAWLTEFDVLIQLRKLGHEVKVFGIIDNLNEMLETINSFNPHLVFNLLEEFNFDTRSDYKVIALLEMLNIKYTGCNSKGLLLSRDKALTKKILTYHNLSTPKFFTFPKGKKRKLPKSLHFPLMVKCLYEEASYGIAKASIVHSTDKLIERVQYINENLNQDAIIEEFIEGEEVYVGIIGQKNLSSLPVWKLNFSKVEAPEKEIYSSRAKWNKDYRDRKGITTGPAKFDSILESKIIKYCKKAYRVLELSGYARIDLRITSDRKIYILEVNPNPNIATDDEFARSANHQKINYGDLLTSILPS